jgi:hypothetical protein
VLSDFELLKPDYGVSNTNWYGTAYFEIISSALKVTSFVSFRFVSFRSPSLFYLLTAGVEVVHFSLDHTQTHTTVGRTPLDGDRSVAETSYLTTQTLYKRQTSMSPVGFEPTIPASALPQTPRLRQCGHWDRQVTSSYSVSEAVLPHTWVPH